MLVPVSDLYARLWALIAFRAASCPDCLALPVDRFCMSHVCLDCGRMAHPHGLGC